MRITYYGHSCFAAEINGKHLLFDPFIIQNSLAKAVDIKKIRADYIFVSQAHFDHMADAVIIANQTDATVISNYEIFSWLGKNGVKNVQPLNAGGTFSADFGRARCVNAIHSSSFENGTYGGIANGFIIESAEGNFYYSGDTALTLDMELVSETTSLKFAVLCIGGTLTMDSKEAIRAAALLQCKDVMGVHYDTFPNIKIDHAAAEEMFRSKGLTLHLLPIGGSQDL
ncbi:MAG TPA: metal-dependent hydrolase [Verrucomicrobiae bacterium]|nr:metal-dependent hydrolase [Verrucomicrobiae bacterium]